LLCTNHFFCIYANRDAQLAFNRNCTKCSDGSCPPLYFIMHNTSNVLESFISTPIHKIRYKKGGADMFKALQHIKAKSATREVG
jgi:hypothetical protein